jgi:hypothetical protein
MGLGVHVGVGVPDGVMDGVGDAETVVVDVSVVVGVGVGVPDGVWLGVGELVGVSEGVGVLLGVGVFVGVSVGELVGVSEGVGVLLGVGVFVGVGVGVPDGVWVDVGVFVGVCVGELVGVGVKRMLVESTVRIVRPYVFAHTCRVARGIVSSFTRMVYRARVAGEAVVTRRRADPAERRRAGAPPQVPRFRGSVGATEWLMLLAFVHDTRRTRDAATPVALAKAQRRSVTLESERMLLWASTTTLRMDWSGGSTAVVVISAFSPSPRPIASATMTAKKMTTARERRLESHEVAACAASPPPFPPLGGEAAAEDTSRSTSWGGVSPPPSFGPVETMVCVQVRRCEGRTRGGPGGGDVKEQWGVDICTGEGRRRLFAVVLGKKQCPRRARPPGVLCSQSIGRRGKTRRARGTEGQGTTDARLFSPRIRQKVCGAPGGGAMSSIARPDTCKHTAVPGSPTHRS